MSNTNESILEKALSLSSNERSMLAEKLISSLDVPDSDTDKVWADEADYRYEAYQRGEIKTVSSNEVFAKYRK